VFQAVAKIYGEVGDDKVLEIQSWRERSSGGALVMQRLDDRQASAYRQMRSEGHSDTQIWRALHPQHAILAPLPSPAPRKAQRSAISLGFEELPTVQLIWIIEQLMGQRAPSLGNMTHVDLVQLARFASNGRRIQLSFGD
jgi:hypothetical protein